MVKFKIGIVMAVAAILFLCFALVNEKLTTIEMIITIIFCLIVITFGVLIERKRSGIWPQFKEEFSEERKF